MGLGTMDHSQVICLLSCSTYKFMALPHAAAFRTALKRVVMPDCIQVPSLPSTPRWPQDSTQVFLACIPMNSKRTQLTG